MPEREEAKVGQEIRTSEINMDMQMHACDTSHMPSTSSRLMCAVTGWVNADRGVHVASAQSGMKG